MCWALDLCASSCLPQVVGEAGRDFSTSGSLSSTPVLICFSPRPVLLSFPTSAVASLLESLVALDSAEWKEV